MVFREPRCAKLDLRSVITIAIPAERDPGSPVRAVIHDR